jgi:tight adherence protein C
MLALSNLHIGLFEILLVFAAGCGVFGVMNFFVPDARLRRLRPAPAGQLTPRPGLIAAPPSSSVRRGGTAFERLVSRPFKDAFVPGDKKERSALNTWLLQAGKESPLAAQVYYAFRIGLLLVVGLVGAVAVPLALGKGGSGAALIGGAFGMIIGFEIPVIWIARHRKSRIRQITEGLPEILDLLLVCTEAGLGLDTALDRVGKETEGSQPILSYELRLITNELRAGRPRQATMRQFAERTGAPEVQSLVNLLVQSDTFGTSIAATLRVFAEDMRMRRLLKAEETANKVSVKLSMILVGFFLPALVTAIMAPVLLQAARNFAKIKF